MKTTYLIYKQIDGIRRLTVATQDEWDAILKENKRLPLPERRCFIKDCIEDGNELDCMYIEVSASEHQKWNSRNTVAQRKCKLDLQYQKLSLDTGAIDLQMEAFHECIPSAFDLEALAGDHVLMAELKAALRKWKPWAEELLEIYLSGAKRSCTGALCEKHQLSDRAVRKRKRAFEKFVLDFLKK